MFEEENIAEELRKGNIEALFNFISFIQTAFNEAIDFCNKYDYDIRKSGNGRWIDQKCAADVVTVIADCIYNYESENPDSTFTTPDIWHYDYAVENVEAIFKKPGVESKAAKNEYDKFFQQ